MVSPQKRTFLHGVLSTDPLKHTLKYEKHIKYGELKAGQFLGLRTLLDKSSSLKHIWQHMYRFADQVGLNADKFIQRRRHSSLL